MRKGMIICAAGVIATAATATTFAGCSSEPLTLESISKQFLEEDADPIYQNLSNVTKYESEYDVADYGYGLVSVLYYKDLGVVDRTSEEFYNDAVFMKKWHTIQSEATNVYKDLHDKLQQRLENNGYDSDDITYLITVVDDSGKENPLYFYVDEEGVTLDSLSLYETVADTTTASTEPETTTSKEPETTTETTEAISISKQNAIKQAESYLKHNSFSRSGLIHQLEYEKYSTEDATYAVDHINVDWREQCVKQAESYLKHNSFSRSGLIQQLEYEGFSTDDATFAADNITVDWNEQAAKQAKSYLSHSAFSHDELIDQLVYEGYTYEQAEYGVSQTGL